MLILTPAEFGNPAERCHRVVASDGSIGGFHGERKGEMIMRKLKLLEEEKNAVQIDNPNLFSEEF